MRLDFGSVPCDNSISNSNAHLSDFVGLGVLILNFLVLNVLSLLSSFSVLFVKTIRLSCLDINHSILSHNSPRWKAVRWRHVDRRPFVIGGLSGSNW